MPILLDNCASPGYRGVVGEPQRHPHATSVVAIVGRAVRERRWAGRPSKQHEAHIADPSDPSTCKWSLNVSYPPLAKERLGVRLRALPSVAADSTADSVDLLTLSDPSVKRSKACVPGGSSSGLISRVVATPPSGGPAAGTIFQTHGRRVALILAY